MPKLQRNTYGHDDPAFSQRTDDTVERYLVKWVGHVGRTWEAEQALEGTKAFKEWRAARHETAKEPNSWQRGLYVLGSGIQNTRHCCDECQNAKSWNQRVYIDAEFRGNVSFEGPVSS